ncbi:MAG: small ribosomal subunit Rsm22 family protein [Candidatus Methanoperedens sp.]|nr:small ribosomal subunit Rsm22 family protein [Candidatus Methanoperedens sp.]
MTPELLSLAKFLVSSRAEFALSEMNQYLSRRYEEKDLYETLKPHFFDLELFCDTRYNCRKLINRQLPADEQVIHELEEMLKAPWLPLYIEKLIDSYIERSCGKDWHTGETARILRENIVKQKEEYWRGSSKYPKLRVITYLLYHFPVYFCQFQYLLLDLLKGGLLTTKMSIVDVGSGPGTITLSTIDFLHKLLSVYSKKGIDIKLNIKIDSIEKVQENIDCYKELTSLYLSKHQHENASIIVNKPVNSPLEKAQPVVGADLIIFSNVLAEMSSPHAERARAVEKLSSGSLNPTVLLVEPADLVNSKALRITQQALMNRGFTVYSPCTFLWGAVCTGGDCWSFREEGNIRVPDFMRKIAGNEEAYRYLNTDMKFTYAILRKDGAVKQKYRAKGKFARLSTLKKHLKKRINVAVSVMSGNLGDEKTFVFKICDGTTSVPCYAVIPAYHKNDNNKALLEANYGSIVEIFGALVRENEEFSSYNLLINRNTIVEPVK